METSQIDVARWYDEAWREETWSVPWSRAIADLTPQQAAWKPDACKHSIWMLVNHIAFWREYTVRLMGGEQRDEDLINRCNWMDIPPEDVTEEGWQAALTNIQTQQKAVHEAMQKAQGKDLNTLKNFIEHDAYHMGQIMLLRAMQGLKPLDSFG
ncbi:MAG: DinB family protein [Planctomycetota bacterium]|nr:DinB family protein [Planctomycetota bacterium]